MTMWDRCEEVQWGEGVKVGPRSYRESEQRLLCSCVTVACPRPSTDVPTVSAAVSAVV